ncbi:MAG TPA: hypothetical protein PLF32_04615 [Bacteroidales bacterium]|nr:hypothetical protein [Bacteroidales bacterium]HOR81915.1 hypothetical protein [Bacteroidales bacterium]HPJ91147.1 hypothetical protein [Bacteroidales bacterium]HQB19655.1 hypothetical protein [Bacteroidales bacterium]
MKPILKILLVLCGIGIYTIYTAFFIMIAAAFGGFDKDYSVTELKENFEAKKMKR